MEFRIITQQTQKQILSPSMQQSIEVLLLPLTELSQTIELELQNNPLLEIDEEKEKALEKTIEDIILAKSKSTSDNNSESEDSSSSYDDEEEVFEKPLTKGPGLEDVLFEQLRMEFSDPMELKIGEVIISCLNEDGYLTASLEEIAQLAQILDLELVETILEKIQMFEPLGIASRDLRECLLNQLRQKNFNGHDEHVRKIIESHLDLLGRKKFTEISRALKVSEDKVRELAHLISTLEPKPARKYRPLDSNIYVKPDIVVTKDVEDVFHLNINQDSIPPLRISIVYQKLLKQGNCKPEELEFIKDKIKNALLFIKSIEQRHQTLREIAQYILEQQKGFFENGTGYLQPMILKDIAQAINRNESTVSRAIQNKFIDTPHGTYPLKYFFSQALVDEHNGHTVSNRNIKEELKTLVEQENKERPFSDQEIQKMFELRGMNIARRTISKYRQQLNILPAHLRKQ
jgi:RNA polymerase sigma-54 factor